MIKNPKKLKGFTLVEILVAVFLGTIIVMAGYSVFNMSYKSYKKNYANTELNQNARIALERMSREIRQARDITTTLPENAIDALSAIQFQDGHGIVQTGVPTNCDFLYITFSLSGNDLHRQLNYYYLLTDPNTCIKWDTYGAIESALVIDEIKAQQITDLQFWGTQKTVSIHFTVTDGQSSYQFETKTTARNAP